MDILAAVKMNNHELLIDIIEENPDLINNRYSLNQLTLLHYAASYGHVNIIVNLIRHGIIIIIIPLFYFGCTSS